MSRALLVPFADTTVPEFADRAERLGYDALWSGELWGRDVFVSLTRAATATDSIELGSAIANVYGRSPATLAQAAATLDDASNGRVRLGLGTSTRKAVEDLHGASFDNPARQLHETTELARQFLHDDDRVSYDGERFSVADFPGLETDVPVYTAALGAATRRATGRTADGWIPHNIPWDRLDSAFETIADAATNVDRNPADIRVAPYVPSAVSEDGDEARATVRGHVAYYVGSGEGYRRAVAETFPEAADAIASAWSDGDRGAAREAVTDEMVARLGIAGEPDEARSQLADLESRSVIDEAIVVVPAGTDPDIVDLTVETLAP